MFKKTTALLLTLILFGATACSNAGNPSEAPGDATLQPEQSEVSSLDINRLFNLNGESIDIDDPPIAELGEYVALRSDYAFFFQSIRSNLEYNATMNGFGEAEMAEFWDFDTGDGTTVREMLKKEALNTAKEFAILYSLAEKGGTQPDEELNLQADLDVLSILSEMGNNEQTFVDTYHITPQQLREINYRLNLFNKFQAESIEKIEVSDADIQAIYDDSPDLYNKVTVRHVLITCDDTMSEEEQADALSLAEEVLQKLKDGEDIGVLALTYSEDPGSQYSNGEYTFGKGEMVPEFEEWAFAAKQGDQGMVKTDYGYHIMELITPAGFEAAKDEIAFNLRNEIFFQSMQEEYALVSSPDWILNQEVIDTFVIEIPAPVTDTSPATDTPAPATSEPPTTDEPSEIPPIPDASTPS